MKVVVREIGYRPALSTPARINAPQGAKALADLLSPHDFADLCVINIDWEGDGFTPALTIKAVKFFPQFGGRRLEADWVLSIDDAFGIDNFNNDVARQIVHELQALMEERASLGPPGS